MLQQPAGDDHPPGQTGGVEVRLVHPAYTSIIGRLKYQPQYAISVHQAAAMVIGRRGVGYEQERVPQKLVSLCAKRKRKAKPAEYPVSFQALNNWKQWAVVKKKVKALLKEKVTAAIKAEIAARPPKEDGTRPENEVEAARQKRNRI